VENAQTISFFSAIKRTSRSPSQQNNVCNDPEGTDIYREMGRVGNFSSLIKGSLSFSFVSACCNCHYTITTDICVFCSGRRHIYHGKSYLACFLKAYILNVSHAYVNASKWSKKKIRRSFENSKILGLLDQIEEDSEDS
jgi:hypothetical protein